MFRWIRKSNSDSKPRPDDSGINFEFVRIEPGTFIMGQGADEPEPDDMGPQHQVTLSRPYKISAKTITRDQFARFVEATGYQTSDEISGKGIINARAYSGLS